MLVQFRVFYQHQKPYHRKHLKQFRLLSAMHCFLKWRANHGVHSHSPPRYKRISETRPSEFVAAGEYIPTEWFCPLPHATVIIISTMAMQASLLKLKINLLKSSISLI